MVAWTRLRVWIGVGALGLVACSGEINSGEQTTASTSASASSGGGMGGAGGAGGADAAGGAPTASASGTGGGQPFLTCNVKVATFENDDCDFLNQDCPDGKQCFPDANKGYATSCIVWGGVKTLGAQCTSHSECAAGLFCGLNFCAPPCCPDDTDVPCSKGACNVETPLLGAANKANICNYAPKCTLFTADACKPGLDCHMDMSQGLPICVPYIKPEGQEPGQEPMEGQVCNHLNNCPNMQQCWEGVCRHACDTNLLDQPPGLGGCLLDRVCATLKDPPPGYDSFGICIEKP